MPTERLSAMEVCVSRTGDGVSFRQFLAGLASAANPTVHRQRDTGRGAQAASFARAE
jgi:hypothetical protein